MGMYLRQILEAKNTHGKDISGKMPDYIKSNMAQIMRNNGVPDDEISKMSQNADNDEDESVSLNSKDRNRSNDSIFPERFNKEKMKLLVESKNIIEEYKAYIDFEIENIINGKYKDKITGIDQSIGGIYKSLIDIGIKRENIKRYITETFFEISDDPKVIKRSLQLRINYNNKIVNLLQKMLKINYNILGISSEEANILSKNLSSNNSQDYASSIKNVRNLIINNDKKFRPRPDMIDLRPLGFGVAFITKEDLESVERFAKLDRLLHLLMRYDCVVVGHGNGKVKKETNSEIDKLYDKSDELHQQQQKVNKRIKELNKELRKSDISTPLFDAILDFENQSEHDKKYILNSLQIKENEINEYKAKVKVLKKINDEIETLGHQQSQIRKEFNDIQDEIKSKGSDPKNIDWTIQSIKTLSGGNFTNINDLLRQLINEGFKKINLISCNPYHAKIDDDILKKKGVIIHSANNNLLAENSIILDNLDSLNENYTDEDVNCMMEELGMMLTSSEISLMEFCDANEVDYNNQLSLEESYFFIQNNPEYIEEGIKDTIKNTAYEYWTGLKIFVKKIIQALIYIFKNAIAYARALFNKLRELVTGVSNPDGELKNNTVSFVSLENMMMVRLDVDTIEESAQVKEIKANNFNQIKAAIIKSCTSISKQIEMISKKQINITKQTESYIEKRSKQNMNEMVDTSIIKYYDENTEEVVNENVLVAFTIAVASQLLQRIIAKSIRKIFFKKTVKHYNDNNCKYFVTDSMISALVRNDMKFVQKRISKLCTEKELPKVILDYCLQKAEYKKGKDGTIYVIAKEANKSFYIYQIISKENKWLEDSYQQFIKAFTLSSLLKNEKYKVKVVDKDKFESIKTEMYLGDDAALKYYVEQDSSITNHSDFDVTEDVGDGDNEYDDDCGYNGYVSDEARKALEIIRARKEKQYETCKEDYVNESTNDSSLSRTYNDTHLYSLVADNYNKQLLQFIRTAHEIDKNDESFKDIEYDIKRRQTSVAILKILQSPNIVLMISENHLPLPRTFKVITAVDIRQGETRKKKVFIDVTGLISNEGGVYKCNPRSVDILISYIVDAALQFIYYADPKRIVMNRDMITEGAWCFSTLFTYIIDYLVKVSVNGNMRNQIMYISSLYYLKTILNKDISDSHLKTCKDISGLSDREIELLSLKFEDDNYDNIKTFVNGISELCLNDKITLDVIVNKWIYIYGQGTQFALELFPAFANMITNAYNGQFLNNQMAIEKQCGSHMVTFSKRVLNIIEEATK